MTDVPLSASPGGVDADGTERTHDADDHSTRGKDEEAPAAEAGAAADNARKSDGTPPASGGSGRRIGSIYRSTDKGIRIVHSDHPVGGGDGPREGARRDPLAEEERDATWREVWTACCCHSIGEWFQIFVMVCVLLFFLYFFLVGLDMLGTSFQVVGGCTAGSLLGSDTNPLASVLIGIVATALLQSSSTTTSIVVSMCGAGLDVQQGEYCCRKIASSVFW